MRLRTWLIVSAAGLLMLAGCSSSRPDGGVPNAPDYSPVIQEMSRRIPDLMKDTGTVGLSIALVDGDEIVWTQGFGFADRKAREPVSEQTTFHIGSVSKTMTAIAVMQLVESGHVDLDAPLSRYVPDFSLWPGGSHDSITVRTVLDHHSGIPGDVFNGLFTEGAPDPSYRPWLIQALHGMNPERPVNTVWAYNNSGFVLLQQVVENVSGMPFAEYARQHLFTPMAMPATTYDDSLTDPRTLTRNYEALLGPGGSVRSPVRPREYINGWGAGSVTSSAADMANYLRTLAAGGQGQQGRVLPKDALDEMWTAQIVTPLDILYFQMGLGFALGHPELNWTGRVVQHDGGTSWNLSFLALLPDSGLGVFTVANTADPANPAAQAATQTLSRAYAVKTGVPLPPPATLPEAEAARLPNRELRRHAGIFATGTDLDRVSMAGGRLRWTQSLGAEGQATARLTPMKDGWFRPSRKDWPQVQFRTIEGRQLMVTRLAWGPQVTEVMHGQKVVGELLTRPWRERVGRYRPVDANPRTTAPFRTPWARISLVAGLPVLEMPSETGRQVLSPASATRAMTYGLGPALGRGKGDVVVAKGSDRFRFLGVTYRRSR